MKLIKCIVIFCALFLTVKMVTCQDGDIFIKGFVISDEGKPLPFASIQFNGTTNGTITNEDGLFIIDKNKLEENTISVSYIGYKTNVFSFADDECNITIRLEKLDYSLNEIIIIGTRDNLAYHLTKKLIKKYRFDTKTIKSKAFLSLYSQMEDPLEIFEAFYNTDISQSSAVNNLELKNGRAGLIKSGNFAFVSLNTTDIICDFSPFKKTHEMKLPLTPTNLSVLMLKSRYNMNVKHIIDNGKEQISVITFTPKIDDGQYFSGELYIDMGQNIIRKYVLKIKNTKRDFLRSINENVTVDSLDIYLELNYSPENTYIQSIVYDYSFQLSNIPDKRIVTKTLLAFYDYNNPFNMPVSEPFNLDYDYHRILSYPYNDVFWRKNYYIPQSQNRVDFTNYFATYGILINHDSLSSNSPYIESPCIAWNKVLNLHWSDFKLKNTNLGSNLGTPYIKNNNSLSNSYNLDGHLFLDYTITDGKNQYVSQTTFNRYNSYALNYVRNDNTLIFLNMCFDLYEVYRIKLMHELNSKPNLKREEIELVYQTIISDLHRDLKRLKYETRSGNHYSSLLKWNEYFYEKLGVNNVPILSK